MDPHAVLGLEPDASPEEVQRAYRALAKRFHPDRAGEGAGELMSSINAAYEVLREQLIEGAGAAPGGPPAPAPRRPPAAGAWLAPRVRRILARELLLALEPGEAVHEVVLTSTGDSPDVQLAVTDRRLLWLRDDAIMGRVRSLRHREIAGVAPRQGGLLRRRALLEVETVTGRRVRFFDLPPDLLARLVSDIGARIAR